MTKRNILLIVAIGVVLVFLVLLLYLLGVFTSVTQPSSGNQTGSTFPVSSTTTSSNGLMVLKGAQSSQTVVVKDFINNGQTVEDAHDSGTYVLASNSAYCLEGDNCPTGTSSTTGFQISYQAPYQYFTVLLLQEPLGASREAAQAFLETALGISASQLCALHYSVGTIQSVNSQYAGDELGFSSCPNSVMLPQ